jgi:hypothetical protein
MRGTPNGSSKDFAVDGKGEKWAGTVAVRELVLNCEKFIAVAKTKAKVMVQTALETSCANMEKSFKDSSGLS